MTLRVRAIVTGKQVELSVNDEYLALEDGPPIFRQDYTCPALLVVSSVPHVSFRIQDYHLLWSDFPDCFAKNRAITNRLNRDPTNLQIRFPPTPR